jgi:hypothetical protein
VGIRPDKSDFIFRASLVLCGLVEGVIIKPLARKVGAIMLQWIRVVVGSREVRRIYPNLCISTADEEKE